MSETQVDVGVVGTLVKPPMDAKRRRELAETLAAFLQQQAQNAKDKKGGCFNVDQADASSG